MKQKLSQIIIDLEKHLQDHSSDMILQSECYMNISSSVEDAKRALGRDDMEKVFIILGSINIDLLEEVYMLDTILSTILQKVGILHKDLVQQKKIEPSLSNIIKRLQESIDIIEQEIRACL